MDNPRDNEITEFLDNLLGQNSYKISKIAGDASFRNYSRISQGKKSYMLMDSPPEIESNHVFFQIANHLKSHGINSPKIFGHDLDQGLLLLEDFGDISFQENNSNGINISLYKEAIKIIKNIQSIEPDNNIYADYSRDILLNEMRLFSDWYLDKGSLDDRVKSSYEVILKGIRNSNDCIVHRDFHSRNLMIHQKSIGVIDFQDALIGPRSYDLVSLLYDAYIEISENDREELIQYFIEISDIKISYSKFREEFDFVAIQRLLKVLGIFKRLSLRDKKHQYLFDIPLVENYLLQILSKYPDLEGLKNLILEEKDKKAIMILAAGKGERMMPLTESIPKPLLKIGDKALIDYSIASALNAGFSKIVVNTFYLGNLISSHLSDRYQDIIISEEKSPLETAGGIINALTHLGNNPFAVMNSDVYTNFRLEKLLLPENSLAHLVLVKNPEHNPEGDFSLDEQSFINITSKNQYTFSGIGIYHPELFRDFIHSTGKLPLYKVLLQAIDNHQVTGELFDDVWFDVGTPERLKNINKFQAESNNL